MVSEVTKPLEDKLTMTVYGPNSEVLWHAAVRAIPRVGEHIVFASPERKGWTRGGIVEKIFWWMQEKLPGQHVAVFLDEITEKDDKAPPAQTGSN